MKHLLSYSVFQPLSDFSETDVGGFLAGIGCDGLELFTMFDPVCPSYLPYTVSTHLPYAVDWHRAWSGDMDGFGEDIEDLRFITFGRDREEMVANIRRMMDVAACLDPAYGVFHAGNTDMEQMYHHDYASDDRKVLEAFAEMVNAAVSCYRGGEPPLKLALENLWWSGLKLREPWEHRLLEDKLEFDNWCLCLDVGHLMNGLPDSTDEAAATAAAMRVIDGYPQDMRDRIEVMHLHCSTSAEYRRCFDEKDVSLKDIDKLMRESYKHVGMIDQHKPFTDKRCTEFTDAIQPDFVTHEMISDSIEGVIANFRLQRSHFS